MAAASATGGLVVVAVVLSSALLHATWNALAHSSRDRLSAITLIAIADLAISVPLILFAPTPARAVWPFIAVSSVLEAVYAFGLVMAYRLGEFSRVYPLARGTSPLVVALVSTLILGQHASAVEWIGIVAVCAGLLTVAFADGLPSRADLPAVIAAVATGCVIASYTIVDGVAVRRSGTVLGYAGWIFFLQGLMVVGVSFAIRRRALAATLRPDCARGLAGGAISMLAYGMVLWAQTRGSLAGIATLRETSILIGCLIGTVLFHERFGRTRLVASAGVVTGILLIAHP
jgi:drug/metabolite transporter (DMT)-like permease